MMNRKRTLFTAILISFLMLPQISMNLNAQDENPAQPLDRIYTDVFTHDATNKIYLLSGTAGHGFDDVLLTDVWAFDLTSRKWNYVCQNKATIYVNALGITVKSTAQDPAFDIESDRIISFNAARQTWAFHPETRSWQKMAPEIYPLGRVGQHTAYDSESDRVIFFGGIDINLSSLYGDTWAYDYNTDTWEEMKPENPPLERCYGNMVYNSRSDRVMLWGGRTGKEPFPDKSIWEYDYNTNTWSEIVYEDGPAYPYAYSEILYDSTNNEVYMYGGAYLTDRFTGWTVDENWIYHCADSTWTLISVEGGPGKVENHTMAFLRGNTEILLFGGEIGNIPYTNEMLKGTWIMDYTGKSWHEEVFAFAGNDAALCSDQVEGRLLGGENTAWGGSEPYDYSWSADGTVNGEPVEVDALLDDPTAANPALITSADSVKFFLEVTDQAGTVAYDTVDYMVSSLSVCQDIWEEEFFKGESVQLDHCVEGGVEPLTYLWEPAEFLSDSSASNPVATPDSATVTFHLVVTDTIGCEVTSDFTAQYSTVGLEPATEKEVSVTVRSVIDGTGSRLLIENRLTGILNIEILGISGRLIERFNLPSGTSERYLTSYLPGLYLYRITSSEAVIGTGKFVIQ